MTEFIEKAVLWMRSLSKSFSAFYAANRILLLSGVTIVSILLIIWARLGFSLQIGRFFAASPGSDPNQCFSYDANGNGDDNFSQFNALGNPTNLVTGSGNTTLSYQGHYTNNCDFVVHLTFNSSGGNAAGGTAVSPQDFATDSAFTRDPVDVAAHTTGIWKFTFDRTQFSCGRVNANAAWNFGAFPNSPSTKGLFAVLFNYGVSCGSGGTPTPAPTAAPAAAAVLSVQCGATQNVLTWTLVSGRSANSILKGVDGAAQNWVCGGPDNLAPCTNLNVNTFTDTNAPAGHIYTYTQKAAANLPSNTVVCPVPPTATPTLAPTNTPQPTIIGNPTPTPTGTPLPTSTTNPVILPTLVCAPQSQSVVVNQAASLQAAGGNGTYNWASEGQLVIGANATFTYATAGTKQAVVISAGQTATCTVTVQNLPTPTPNANLLALQVLGHNVSTGTGDTSVVSVIPGQQAEVLLHVVNTSAQPFGNVLVNAILPAGITLIPNTTTVGNLVTGNNNIATGGLSVGALSPQQQADIRFRVIIDVAGFPYGATQAGIIGQAAGDGGAPVAGQVILLMAGQTLVTTAIPGTPTPIPTGTGVTNQVSTVQTGPGDAVLAAFLLSAVITLLYVSYTRSPLYRAHEAEKISRDQGPMDFRG